jgi:hemoglobin
MSEEATTASVYEQVGGMPFFERLVDRFYDGVEDDPVLAPLYPEAPDFSGARHRLTLFLAQYWGGPTTYNEERGHPMLRMRHMPYPVGPAQRDRWMVHMTAALQASDAPPAIKDEMLAYFDRAAEHLRNDPKPGTLPLVP